MKKKIIIIGCIVAAILAAVIFFCFSEKKTSSVPTKRLKEKIHLMKAATIPMRFKIITSLDGKPLLAAKFFNLDGKMVGRFDTPYYDGCLKFYFTKFDIDGYFLTLPDSIFFSGSKGGNMLNIRDYFFEENYPQIYSSKLIDSVLKGETEKLFLTFLSDSSSLRKTNCCNFFCDSLILNRPGERIMYEMKIFTSGQISIKHD